MSPKAKSSPSGSVVGPATTVITQLETKLQKIEEDAKGYRDGLKRIEALTFVVLGIVFAGFVLIALDYWKYNEQRYEQTQEHITQASSTFANNEAILKCFKDKGYFAVSCYPK